MTRNLKNFIEESFDYMNVSLLRYFVQSMLRYFKTIQKFSNIYLQNCTPPIT